MTQSFALQKGIFDRLSNDAGLAAVLGPGARVFDDPPASAAFPYIVIGEARAAKIAGADATEHDIRIEMFSRHAGRKEVKQILDALFASLHDADFPLEGARLVNCRFVFGEAFRGEEGLFRGLARFRCVTEAA